MTMTIKKGHIIMSNLMVALINVNFSDCRFVCIWIISLASLNQTLHIGRRYNVKTKWSTSGIQIYTKLRNVLNLILQKFRRTHKERLMRSWLILQTRQNSKRIFTRFAYSAKIYAVTSPTGNVFRNTIADWLLFLIRSEYILTLDTAYRITSCVS